MKPAHDNSSAFQAQLREVLARELNDDALQIESFSRRGEGYSWETYLISVSRSGGALDRYAVKREPTAGLLGTYDVQREVDLLRAARNDIGCPAPRVIAFKPRAGEVRGFYAMEMIDGVVPMPWDVKKIVADETVRRQLGLELAEIMARLHGADINKLRIGAMASPTSPGSTGIEEVQRWREVYLSSLSVHLPIVDLAFAWLTHRADWVSGKVALVHNDLRVGNVIVKDGHVAAVLDWETAQFTDPAADLAKFNLPTFRGRSQLASGLLDWAEFLDAYQAASGWRPSAQALNYWTVLEIVKAVVGSLRGLHYYESGKTDDIRYANMGWQTHHSIKWLIELFDSGVWGK